MYTVHYKSKEGEASVRVGKVMFGTGRKPNTRGIGLEVGPRCICLASLIRPCSQACEICPRSCCCNQHACMRAGRDGERVLGDTFCRGPRRTQGRVRQHAIL
jgi:hypothetical protein